MMFDVIRTWYMVLYFVPVLCECIQFIDTFFIPLFFLQIHFNAMARFLCFVFPFIYSCYSGIWTLFLDDTMVWLAWYFLPNAVWCIWVPLETDDGCHKEVPGYFKIIMATFDWLLHGSGTSEANWNSTNMVTKKQFVTLCFCKSETNCRDNYVTKLRY